MTMNHSNRINCCQPWHLIMLILCKHRMMSVRRLIRIGIDAVKMVQIEMKLQHCYEHLAVIISATFSQCVFNIVSSDKIEAVYAP